MTSDIAPNRDRSVPDRVAGLDMHAQKWDGDGLVPAHLLGAWEAVYRDYVSTSDRIDPRNIHDRQILAQVSARVAVTWRQLAEAPGIKWCLVASFSTAAEAMEQQARDWGFRGLRSL